MRINEELWIRMREGGRSLTEARLHHPGRVLGLALLAWPEASRSGGWKRERGRGSSNNCEVEDDELGEGGIGRCELKDSFPILAARRLTRS